MALCILQSPEKWTPGGTMGESHNPAQVTYYVFYYIDLVILAPLDLVIFVIMSKKTKNAIKDILCVYIRWEKIMKLMRCHMVTLN